MVFCVQSHKRLIFCPLWVVDLSCNKYSILWALLLILNLQQNLLSSGRIVRNVRLIKKMTRKIPRFITTCASKEEKSSLDVVLPAGLRILLPSWRCYSNGSCFAHVPDQKTNENSQFIRLLFLLPCIRSIWFDHLHG